MKSSEDFDFVRFGGAGKSRAGDVPDKGRAIASHLLHNPRGFPCTHHFKLSLRQAATALGAHELPHQTPRVPVIRISGEVRFDKRPKRFEGQRFHCHETPLRFTTNMKSLAGLSRSKPS